jgi:uncharacterized protein with FMN-binding domain
MSIDRSGKRSGASAGAGRRAWAGRALGPASGLLAALCLLTLASCSVDKTALAAKIGLTGVELSAVPDGVYESAYTITPPPPAMAANKSVAVRVTVAAGKLTDIELLSPASLKESASVRSLFSRVKDTQKVSVDAVSSGTITSLAILKAIQDAVGKPAVSR